MDTPAAFPRQGGDRRRSHRARARARRVVRRVGLRLRRARVQYNRRARRRGQRFGIRQVHKIVAFVELVADPEYGEVHPHGVKDQPPRISTPSSWWRILGVVPFRDNGNAPPTARPAAAGRGAQRWRRVRLPGKARFRCRSGLAGATILPTVQARARHGLHVTVMVQMNIVLDTVGLVQGGPGKLAGARPAAAGWLRGHRQVEELSLSRSFIFHIFHFSFLVSFFQFLIFFVVRPRVTESSQTLARRARASSPSWVARTTLVSWYRLRVARRRLLNQGARSGAADPEDETVAIARAPLERAGPAGILVGRWSDPARERGRQSVLSADRNPEGST